MKLGASAAWLGGSTLASQVLLLGSLPYSAIGPAYFSAAARGTREGNERIALQLLRLSAALLSVPMLTLAATGWVDRLFDVYQQQPAALALEAGFTCVVLVVFWLALRADVSGDRAILAFAALSAIYYHLYVWVAFRRSGMATSGIARLALLMWHGLRDSLREWK
jgi:UDP-N-acetylmuramyl pentapeptide phosphotransferase/UDP-N-acetylglucosamine-1-phosphate transferase